MESFIYLILKVHCLLIRVQLYSFANYLEKKKQTPAFSWKSLLASE